MAGAGRLVTLQHGAEANQGAGRQGRCVFLRVALGLPEPFPHVHDRVVRQVGRTDRLQRISNQVAHLERRRRRNTDRQPVLELGECIHDPVAHAGVLETGDGSHHVGVIDLVLDLLAIVHEPHCLLLARLRFVCRTNLFRCTQRCLGSTILCRRFDQVREVQERVG